MRSFSNRLLITTLILACASTLSYGQNGRRPGGTIEVIDSALNTILNKNAKIEMIADSLTWCEGPVWVESKKMLLFSDVAKNKVFKWTAEKGKELYLTPSGYTGTIPRGGDQGSNGLTINSKGQLILCQDGDRKMAIMDAPIDAPQPKFITLSDNYMGKKFDSPNDLAYLNNGDMYFTDPPYGLEKGVNDPSKGAPYQGIYRIAKDGKITLVLDSLTRPNGIAFFKDGKTVLIANSDNAKPYLYAFDIDKKGMFTNGRIFYDFMAATKTAPGMPDGLKIDKQGTVFATGPGGVWIFNRSGKLLGRIKINGLTSNCAFTGDEKTLFMTNGRYVLKADLR